MRTVIIVILSLFTYAAALFAQNGVDGILAEIEQNNSTLSSLRKSTEAEKLWNKTGLFLKNPEVEFHYLWGEPASGGNRTDFNIRQTFDFPTVYGLRNQLANRAGKQLDISYQQQRNMVLFRVRLLLVEILHTNKLKSMYDGRIIHARQLASVCKTRLEKGSASLLEFNKTQLYLLNIRKETETIIIDREMLLAELAGYNGGVRIDFNDTIYQIPEIPVDFEQWYQKVMPGIPELAYLENEIATSLKQEQLALALSLPGFSAGYMSEKIVNQQLQGITAGISIPLFENANRVKYAKLKTVALHGMETDRRALIYHQLKALHAKAFSLRNAIGDYRQSLVTFGNGALLDKALEKGEISLVEYIIELSSYYDTVTRLHEMERDLNTATAEFYQFGS